MGYGDHLKRLLHPLGLYRLEGTINGSELESMGLQLDLVSDEVEKLEQEVSPITAEDYGLEAYRTLLAHKPDAATANALRNGLLPLIQAHNQVFTPTRAAAVLTALGLDASITETGAYAVTITFHTTPDDLERAKAAIEDLLPCHLTITYG